jgi:hypothetical protein
MATKYRTQFKDIAGNDYMIEFQNDNYSGSTFDLTPAPNPLIIDNVGSDVFAPVKGAGATINLYSSTDRQLIDLYTADYKEWKVLVRRNGGTYFKGYVESELYNETFSETSNYTVQIQCNNGIGILSREKYVKDDGSNYDGITTIYEVINNCLSKIGIDYFSIRIATDTQINNVTPATNKSILHNLTVNNSNYIDEDGITMNCREVLESVLTPLNLSLFIDGNIIYIVDFDYLKQGNISYKEFILNSTTVYNNTIDIVKDLNNTIQLDSSFDIKAGINNYIVNKNRYVKNIIEKVDFNESYEGAKYYDVWELKDNTIKYDVYSNLGTYRRLWIHKLTSFNNYELNDSVLPNIGTSNYFQTHNYVSFAGGFKNQKIVDGTLIPVDTDEVEFDNYIIINSPYLDYDSSEGVDNNDLIRYPVNHFYYDKSAIGRKAAEYTIKSPQIFNSNDTVIKLNFTAQFISTGIAGPFGNMGSFKYRNIDEITDDYGIMVLYTKVLFKDSAGNIKYFLKLKNSENFTKNSEIPKPDDAIYELTPYTGQSFDYCLLYVSDINEAGNQVNIMNRDINVNINIPVNYDSFYELDFQIYNMWFRGSDKDFVNYGQEVQLDYLQPVADFKESIPHLAIKDIFTELVNKETGEEIDLEDEEIQYSLSEIYKTDEIKDELTNYTGENEYITDLAGINFNNDSITLVSNNNYSKSDLEDFKAEKVINQYKNNNINLNMTIQDPEASLMNLYKLNSDPLWSNKNWIARSLSNNIADNEITLNLIELY